MLVILQNFIHDLKFIMIFICYERKYLLRSIIIVGASRLRIVMEICIFTNLINKQMDSK